MPTELGNPYSPLWRGPYPHMLEADYPVWESFLKENPGLFNQIYYDVRVGGIVAPPELGDEKMRYMYWQNTAKRIDAIGEKKNEIWIIEVADRPGLRAVGQLQVYIALWYEDPKIMKPAIPVLVTRGVDSDLERALKFYGVLLRSII